VTLLVLFAFVAGAATALSPCVLPVLPVALTVGATGGRRRPLGVVTGVVLSFTFATVALVYVLSVLGLPDDLFRSLAIAVLAGAGLACSAPAGGRRVEVAVDGRPQRTVVVRDHRLYELVRLTQPGDHLLTLTFERGIEAYAFTFG
jgi:cytochrome c biogenesis protein CcdA